MPGRLYETLELSKKNLTKDEVVKQYRKLSLKFHPDRSKAPDAGHKFKCIKVAYDVLSDDKLKQTYDKNPKKWDKKIFADVSSVTIPNELVDESALRDTNFDDTNLDDLISNFNKVKNKDFYDFFNKFNNSSIKFKIKRSSFDDLLTELLVDYGRIYQGNFTFYRSNRAYVRKFSSIISSVVSQFTVDQSLFAQTYAALWLLTIMDEGKQKFVFDKNIGGEQEALQKIFQNAKVKMALSDAVKLVEKNEFFSRLLLVQHINNSIVNNILDNSIKEQTEKALKFGIGQLYYHAKSINEIIEDGWGDTEHYYSMALLIPNVVLKYFMPFSSLVILAFTPLVFFFATPVIPMTMLGLMVASLTASTLLLGPVIVLSLLAASIAMAVYAKKFGNAIQQEKQEIKANVKATTQGELTRNKYNFFQQKICSIATKSEVSKINRNEENLNSPPVRAIA